MTLSLETKSLFGTEGSGHQKKAWKIIRGKHYLIKLNSKYREAEKEYSASMILSRIGIPCVIYDKIDVKYVGQIRKACICESYLHDGESSISLANIVKDLNITYKESAIEYYNKVVDLVVLRLHIQRDIVERYILATLTVDYLFMNPDRHLNNFEFICNKGIWRPAPLYDFGQSFLCRDGAVTRSEFERLSRSFKSLPFSRNTEKNLINIDFAKAIAAKMSNISDLPINGWHKEVVKRRCEKLMSL